MHMIKAPFLTSLKVREAMQKLSEKSQAQEPPAAQEGIKSSKGTFVFAQGVFGVLTIQTWFQL